MPVTDVVRDIRSAPGPRLVPKAPARRGWSDGNVTDRACLIAELRNAILNGTYHHDSLTIADRLLDRIPSIGATEL